MACYRALDAAGRPLPGASLPYPMGEQDAVNLYTAMARMQVWGPLLSCIRVVPER